MSQPEFASLVFPLRPAGWDGSLASVSVVFPFGGALLELIAPLGAKFSAPSHSFVCPARLPFSFGLALPLAAALFRKKKSSFSKGHF